MNMQSQTDEAIKQVHRMNFNHTRSITSLIRYHAISFPQVAFSHVNISQYLNLRYPLYRVEVMMSRPCAAA